MHRIYHGMEKRYGLYIARMNEVLAQKGKISSWQFRLLSEGLLSDAWQTWCLFSRSLMLRSVRGCRARDGGIINGLPRIDNSWQRICYEAKCHGSVNNQKIKMNGHANFTMRIEPTWGDLDFFIRATQGLSPNNSHTILSAVGSFASLRAMQHVRNACAHKNVQTITELKMHSISYSFSGVVDPIDFIWSEKIGSNEFAIEGWLYDIKEVARLATETN